MLALRLTAPMYGVRSGKRFETYHIRHPQTVTQTEIRQVLDVTKIEQWQPLVTKIKFPFLVSKIPPIPFCTVDRRSRNKFRRGVKSTKFAIADCGSEEEKTKFYRNLSHTSRNYGLEISYGSHSKLWPTPSSGLRWVWSEGALR